VPTVPPKQQNAGQHSFAHEDHRSDKGITDLRDGTIKPAGYLFAQMFSVPAGKRICAGCCLDGREQFQKIAARGFDPAFIRDSQFDAILRFDVLEHIPDYRSAFAECARTLKPGGKMLFSVPFDANSVTNHVRAKLRKDGTIEHLLPPEYHDDPRNPEGCLCFQHFGWEMLEEMKQAGFSSVWALSYYSQEYGYLGDKQMQFLAEK